MNRRFVTCLLALVGFVCCRAGADLAPVPPDPGIDDSLKSDFAADTHASEIAQAVHPEIIKLAAGDSDPATVAMVRQWFIDQAKLQSGGAATPAYQGTYSAELNREFLAVLSQPDALVNTRLNIGIIIFSLQGRTESLGPTIIKLLQDKSAAVAFWGEKAAGAMLPAALNDPKYPAADRDSLLDAVVTAVGAHVGDPADGMVAEEAYKSINPKWNYPPALSSPTGAALSALIDSNLKLQKSRLEIYKTTGVPDSPTADTFPAYFMLQYKDVWDQMTPAQQQDAVQGAVDLISYGGQRAASRSASENSALLEALSGEGEWVSVFGKNLSYPDVEAAGDQVNRLSAASSPDAIKKACGEVFTPMAAQFQNLKQPEDLSAPKSASDTTGGSTPTSEARP
jgi:hypothetical protein